MNRLQYICVQPRLLYYAWQVEVMLSNFLKVGINPTDIRILVGWNRNNETNSADSIEIWGKLVQKYTEVKFFFYEDTRTDLIYLPSIYFNVLKQHIGEFPELVNTPLFCHDCDIIFTRPVDFSEMLDDNIWYMSDTVGYIGTQYLLTKGEDVYLDMCKVMGMDPVIPRIMNSNSGGAQHIIKGGTYEYWDKVEKDSIRLYRHFCDTEPNYKGLGYPIQKWTAGMWSLLWNAWLMGFETRVDKRLDFCMPTDPIEKWGQVPIFHNAGVENAKSGLFYKQEYRDHLPFEFNTCTCKFDKFKCSVEYVKELNRVKQTSCLL